MAEKKKGFFGTKMTFKDLLKLLGSLAIFVPSVSGTIQFLDYTKANQQASDENFRTIVEKLSSQNRDDRFVAASNIGRFIRKGFFFKDGYYYEAVDILINRTSIELDYNVFPVIFDSLQKIDDKEYVIKKLLDKNRNIFIQEDTLNTWIKEAKRDLEKEEREYIKREALLEKYKSGVDKIILDNLKENMKQKLEIFNNREKNLNELKMHQKINVDFISLFLKESKNLEKLMLNFYQNSLNRLLLTGVNLSNARFEKSALSASVIEDNEFYGSTIIDTVFTFSDLTKSSFKYCTITASLFDQAILNDVSFSGSELKDVFFAGSDLSGADFRGARGLMPIYFYAAKNIDKAKFDEEFKNNLFNELPKIIEDDFKKYIENSELSKTRKEDLFLTIKELKEKRKQVQK